MESQEYRCLDAARWPQEPRIEWERETLDDDSRDTSYLDPCADAERLAEFQWESWRLVRIRAKATVYVPIGGGSFASYTLTSPGLWGVESDSDADYLNDIFEEEKTALLNAMIDIGKAASSPVQGAVQ